MNKIIIKNIGPISDVEIELNKVNIIMGPQSSGKSTIAKIINYCHWVEKRLILDGSFNYNFVEKLMDFHRISETYFNEKSEIEYNSNSVKIKFLGVNKNKPTIEKINNGEDFINTKNIYIPAERNFVSVIPNLGKYKETNDNIMNFLYDWYEAKREYSAHKKMPILNLGVSYYYTENTDTDKITLHKHNNKTLTLNNASSGLQSVIPMLLLVDYLSNKIYSSKSFDEKKEFSNFISEYLTNKLNLFDNNKNKNTELQQKENKLFFGIDDVEIEKITNLFIKRSKYHYSQFIIEEPEQNLFPKTQRDLIYYLINKVNNPKYDHKLLITTHSPYILYAINNCIMGKQIADKMPIEEQKELASINSWISPHLISVWEMQQNGTIKSIKNEKTNTVSKHYFNEIMNEIMNEYYEMLNYFEV